MARRWCSKTETVNINKKHVYTVPTVEIIDFETEHILSGSDNKFDVNISNKETEADASMTHKKDAPWSHTWE